MGPKPWAEEEGVVVLLETPPEAPPAAAAEEVAENRDGRGDELVSSALTPTGAKVIGSRRREGIRAAWEALEKVGRRASSSGGASS